MVYFFPIFRWNELLLCTGGLIIHLALVLIGVLAANSGHYHYQFGSIITIIFISNIFRVGFIYALPFSLIMFATQLIAITQLTDVSQEQLTEIVFIYASFRLLQLPLFTLYFLVDNI